MKHSWLQLTLLAPALLLFACEPSADSIKTMSPVDNGDGPFQVTLPQALHEASGLAIASPNHLLVHNDEKGNIYQIILDDMTVRKIASIGQLKTVKDDFEGIAVDDDSIYLSTSRGIIYRVRRLPMDAEKTSVDADKADSGLGRLCELEGLAHLDGYLLLPCKVPRTTAHEDKLVVFSYDIDTGETAEFLSIDQTSIPGSPKLSPSAIEVTPASIYIVSANRLIVVDRKMNSIRVFKLPKKVHIQNEGIAVMEQGTIYLVEDRRKGIAKLTRYDNLESLEEKH